ncbi:MAG: hypothetical protein GPJ54_07660 [Candidatus Heimdallarchaeota archaeon]|nr:hypothetical protein [Candidatus Heimdallarchaeota archaeon]
MTDQENEFSFPLERSPAMKILGGLWTGSFSGQVLVGVLLFIGILFMGNQSFNLLSISFFIGFIMPIVYLMHTRIVKTGKKLMKPWCDVKIENNILNFRTGFPNTTIPGWQEVTLDKKNRDFIIKGNQVGGYHLRLSGDEIIRLGLWMNLDHARKAANDLSVLTKGNVTENTTDDEITE